MTMITDGHLACEHLACELENRGLVRHTTIRMALYKESVSVWYAPPNLPVTGDAYDWMEKLARDVLVFDDSGKKSGVALHRIQDQELYRLIPGTNDQFGHISHFHHRYDAKAGYIRFDPMTKPQKAKVKEDTVRANKTGSMLVLRKFTMGDEHAKVHCGGCNRLVDGVLSKKRRISRWLGQLHHMAYEARQSKNKEGPDPSKLFASTNFYNPDKMTKQVFKKLIDVMGCIVLCPSCHTEEHFEPSGDITNWTNDQLPWALQNQQNWNQYINWLQSLGYHWTFPSYQNFIANQTIPGLITN
jgi:hypothetical protein